MKLALCSRLRIFHYYILQDAATKCSLHKSTTLMKILPLWYLHCVLHLTPILVPKMVNTVQLALVVFFHPSTDTWRSSPAVTCSGGVFLGALAHLLMCTQTNMSTLQLALCGMYSIHIWHSLVTVPPYIISVNHGCECM